MREQKDNYCSDQYEALENLKDTILARDFKEVNIEEVTTEKAVQDVAIDKVDEYKRYIQDRLDIYMKGKLIPDNTVIDSRNGCNAIIKTATNMLIVGCKKHRYSR